MNEILCGDCKCKLNELRKLSFKKRKPCPRCGSLKRQFNLELTATVKSYPHLTLRGKHLRSGKPFIILKQGFDFFRLAQKWMTLIQIVDRENKKYKKIIIDPETGEIIRNTDEPLTDHIGYGRLKRSDNICCRCPKSLILINVKCFLI